MAINFYIDGCPKCRHKRPHTARGPMDQCVKCGFRDDPEFMKEVEARQTALSEQIQLRKDQIKDKKSTGTFKLKELLQLYVGQTIGINISDPGKYTGAALLDTQEDHFCVEINSCSHYIPYSQILRIITAKEGNVSTGVFSPEFPIVVNIFDLVIYKGAIGVGFSMPI